MDTLFSYFILFFTVLPLFFPQQTTASGEISHVMGIIGAIVDNTSRVGKEAQVAIGMAIDDFNTKNPNQSLILHIRNSQSKPVWAALAARDLIDTQQVNAILGMHTWEEASLVAEIGSRAHVPTLSFADSTPLWATDRWPFLVQASPNQYAQMKAVAAIVQSWGWHMITLVYEDIDSVSSKVINNLSDALQEIGAKIGNLVVLPPFHYTSLSQELERLKRDQCRVFVVHTSLELAVHLFQNAKRMEMMTKGYVWIATNTIADVLHSINASTISSMQGIIGVRSYFTENKPQFQDFNKRFRKKFMIEHPEEENNELGISAVQAYDATSAVALSLNESNMVGGQQLREKLSLIDFNGLTCKVQFIERKLAAAHIFRIVNIIGKSYRELGFWSDSLGFSEMIDDRGICNTSMQNLGQMFWPGDPWYTPRGWNVSTSAKPKPLKVGVPTESLFKQFVNVKFDIQDGKYSYTGFSIELFKETVERLPYYLPYEFFPYNGTNDDLVKQVYLKKFDAVLGDVSIVARRYKQAEFTHPYTETGLAMIVPVQSHLCNKAWLFMKPFTKSMWAIIAAINIYNGFVVWLIERNHCPELKGSALNQIGTLLWLAFTTLFSLQGGKLHSNLSRMAMVVWLFVALVLTQSYTANLTSMLTAQMLEPTVADIETLKSNNAIIGHGRGAFVPRYLEDVLGFKPKNLKNFTSPDGYARALRNKEISAVFIEGPFVKLFLAKYCKSFVIAGTTYKVGGFGFVFPKGSPMLLDINKALINVSESGKLRELENRMIGSEKCVDVESINDENASISLGSFQVLFMLTGGTSTISLAIYVIAAVARVETTQLCFKHKSIFTMIFSVIKHWGHRTRQFSSRVSAVEVFEIL